jgi:prevent-host-death family protein
MQFVNVRELKNKTSYVLRRAGEGEDIVVTSRGKPCAVIHSLTENEIEDYILLNHPAFKKRIKESLKEYAAGETEDIDGLIKEAKEEL